MTQKSLNRRNLAVQACFGATTDQKTRSYSGTEFGRDGCEGRAVVLPMDKTNEVIDEYTDQQAVEGGVLVPFKGEGGVNRITCAVFDHFTELFGGDKYVDTSALKKAISTMLNIKPNEDGWRIDTYERRWLWLLPNEVGGLTLMFPDDY